MDQELRLFLVLWRSQCDAGVEDSPHKVRAGLLENFLIPFGILAQQINSARFRRLKLILFD